MAVTGALGAVALQRRRGERASLDAPRGERRALPRGDGHSVRPGEWHLPRLGVRRRRRERRGRALHQRRLLRRRHRDHRLRLALPRATSCRSSDAGRRGALQSARCVSRSSIRRPGRSALRARGRAGRGSSEPTRDPDGPPAEYMEGDLDGDFFQTPYGLFALGAQAHARRAPGEGDEPIGVRLDAGARDPARARGRPLRHVVLDGQPAGRGARGAGDQAAPPERARRRRRPARDAARARDARAPSGDRRGVHRRERAHVPRSARSAAARRGDRRASPAWRIASAIGSSWPRSARPSRSSTASRRRTTTSIRTS